MVCNEIVSLSSKDKIPPEKCSKSVSANVTKSPFLVIGLSLFLKNSWSKCKTRDLPTNVSFYKKIFIYVVNYTIVLVENDQHKSAEIYSQGKQKCYRTFGKPQELGSE